MFKSGSDAKSKIKEYSLFGEISVYVKDPLPKNIDLDRVLKKIQQKIPRAFFSEVDSILIGQFREFYEKKVNAFYLDGAIYLTNLQDDEGDIIDDIVHEVGHAVEHLFSGPIYDDTSLREEFLSKRKKLYYILLSEGYDVDKEEFLDINFCENFDDLLYTKIGYPILKNLSAGLFLSPYSITSIREYFSIGFEKFFLENPYEIQKTCPRLYQKIYELYRSNT